ncbi:TIGR03571 family LLM class oxidoreductase [Salinisphaera sp. Q1T1-3]|uniref:TIGR03571 family LLM class oxidoreductase n=1 Tax=Salinisphaera sp. Q1T1-3 TaxID=2321229 RepID=UPI000E710A86|nr:TIGR03571 family LLM class oxidoreductase [Salinisphaera sp. Q1T1-3]RJS93612.1 TIGR03571 family LLM class oxidoreductase [Salinisphaera sp. Q1T1-3]
MQGSHDTPDTATHPGFGRLFERDEITLGLIMPLATYPDHPVPDMTGHFERARAADEAGLSALWMRDVPFFDPRYGDAGQVFEPLTYIAALARETRHITLGTAGTVLPLREPKMLAKQVASIDHFADGRFVHGLSSGDRPPEYPLFDIDFDSRGERFRDAYAVYRAVLEDSFPHFRSPRFGHAEGALDLLPKPPFGRTPAIAIGRAQQSMDWIAAHLDGHFAPAPPAAQLARFARDWHLRAMPEADNPLKPLGIAGFLDLVADRDHPMQQMRAGFRTGSKALAEFMATARDAGIHHIALNPRITQRPHPELLEDLARDVLPHFPTRPAPEQPAG